jgi:putative ABC transport system permease protein
MKWLEKVFWIWKLSVRNLSRQPRRTLAVLLTVGVGCASLFLFQGFNTGIMNQYRENSIHARYGHGQLHLKGYRDTVFEKPWEHWIEDPQAISRKLLNFDHVRQVFPRIEFFGLLTNGQINVSGRGTGIDGIEESKFFQTLNVEEGKMLEGEPDGILLGKGLATALHVKPGDRVTVLTNTVNGSLNGADLVVTGVFHTGSKEFDDVAFRIPLAQAQMLLDTPKVESIALGLDTHESWTQVAANVAQEFPGLSATEFAVLDKIYYQHSVDWLKSQFGVIRLIILLIVVLGIFNIVATAILERKSEIGNLRANGNSRRGILLLLVSEGMILGLVGAIAGISIAWLLNTTLMSQGILMPPAPGLTRQFHVRMELDWMTAIFTFALGAVCCFVASLLAGWKIVRMPIGEALRSV